MSPRSPDGGSPPQALQPAGEPAAYELAYQEAIRALEEQERAVSETRSRAGQLLAAAAITTSFFGGQVITHHHIHTAGWIAIACFLGLSVAVIVMLWPFGKWSFASSAARLIATYIEPTDNQPPVALAGIHRDLALHMDDSFENNRGKLRWVYLAFRIGALLLAGEVIAWVIALVHHG